MGFITTLKLDLGFIPFTKIIFRDTKYSHVKNVAQEVLEEAMEEKSLQQRGNRQKIVKLNLTHKVKNFLHGKTVMNETKGKSLLSVLWFIISL